MPILRPVPMPDGSLASATPASSPSTSSLLASDTTAAPPSASNLPTEALPGESLASASPATSTAAAPGVDSDAPPAMPPASATPPPAGPEASASASPSQNVTINLINLMVKRGLITKEDAAGLIKQAELEAAEAHDQAMVSQAAASQAQSATAASGPAAASPGGTASSASADTDDDTVHVAYVPDVVKNQIRDEVKADVMKQAKDEHWAAADTTPDWVHRFHVTGDIRVRYEGDLFPDGNATGQITNFNAINTGAPFDVNTATLKSGLTPSYNVDQNRNRFRLRARIGAGIDLGENFYAGMRIGTGSDNQPVSENQTPGRGQFIHAKSGRQFQQI